jgi:hypothetical protein
MKKRARPAPAAQGRCHGSGPDSKCDAAEARKVYCIMPRVAAHAGVAQVASRLCGCCCRAVVAQAHVDMIVARCGADATLTCQTITHAQLW